MSCYFDEGDRMPATVTLSIDGVRKSASVEARRLLVEALRDEFGVTAPHVGCETGRCGACTVLLDGEAVKSCMMLAVQADGGVITTAAGFADGETLHPLQDAFRAHHALQCGFCTPGMLCAAADLLRRNPSPTEAEVRDALRGNLCRCTGYQHIVDAVLAASLPEARA
jgi:aerobic-type carbon monoxide dehydrogenase small subunit (CoxS/CutS family)